MNNQTDEHECEAHEDDCRYCICYDNGYAASQQGAETKLAKLRKAVETYEPLLEGEADDFSHRQWRNAVATLIAAAQELVK